MDQPVVEAANDFAHERIGSGFQPRDRVLHRRFRQIQPVAFEGRCEASTHFRRVVVVP